MTAKARVVYRPATAWERQQMEALNRISLPPATRKKAFIRGLSGKTEISEPQALYLRMLLHHFRRQLGRCRWAACPTCHAAVS